MKVSYEAYCYNNDDNWDGKDVPVGLCDYQGIIYNTKRTCYSRKALNPKLVAGNKTNKESPTDFASRQSL